MNLDQFAGQVGRLWKEFEETGLSATHYFQWAIKKQNEIYELAINTAPTLDAELLNEQPLKRVQGFLKTLDKEINEGKEIEFILKVREVSLTNEDASLFEYLNLKNAALAQAFSEARAMELAHEFANAWEDGGIDAVDKVVLTMLADWFGDINVYVRSEALKFGLPHESNLAIIMGSNFTKLGEDGKPIKDENGKFLKGPNFVAPEAALHANMFGGEQLDIESAEFEEKAHRLSMVVSVLEDPMLEVINAGGEEDYEDSNGDSLYLDDEDEPEGEA
jgi:hypothetical protein